MMSSNTVRMTAQHFHRVPYENHVLPSRMLEYSADSSVQLLETEACATK